METLLLGSLSSIFHKKYFHFTNNPEKCWLAFCFAFTTSCTNVNSAHALLYCARAFYPATIIWSENNSLITRKHRVIQVGKHFQDQQLQPSTWHTESQLKVSWLLSLRTVWWLLSSLPGKLTSFTFFPGTVSSSTRAGLALSWLPMWVCFFLHLSCLRQYLPGLLPFIFFLSIHLYLSSTKHSPTQIYHGFSLSLTLHLKVDSLSKKRILENKTRTKQNPPF